MREEREGEKKIKNRLAGLTKKKKKTCRGSLFLSNLKKKKKKKNQKKISNHTTHTKILKITFFLGF